MPDNVDSTCVIESPEADLDEKRAWSRFRPEQSETYVLLEDEQFPAEVVDESFGGVGLLVRGPVDLSVDDSVELDYCGLAIAGTVRSIVAQAVRTRLGIQWTRRRRESLDFRRPRCRTEADFMIVGGLPVACRIEDQVGSHLMARLPAGNQIELAQDNVRVISRFQRLADLKGAKEELRLLTAVYQLGSMEAADDALRAVLNLEFAPSWD